MNYDEVSLLVNGMNFKGWTGVRITRSIEAAAGSFSLSFTREPDGTGWPIREQDACAVKIGPDTVITGYIDDLSFDLSASDYTISAAGRDKTADIVDCSVPLSPVTWKSKTVFEMAQKLCSPYGINVVTDTDMGFPYPAFSVQPGESIFECLDRAARGRKILISSNEFGMLLLTRSGQVRIPYTLKEGENILQCSSSFSCKERYKTYTAIGQNTKGEKALSAVSIDSYVTRARDLTITAEEAASFKYLTDRAAWESKIRAARAVSVNCTVQGWRTPTGGLWSVNRIVNIDCPSCNVSEEMLITDVSFSLDGSGTLTELTLKRKDAFADAPVMPVNEPGKKK